jgi:hypothetical protein
MAFKHGKDAAIWFNALDLSSYANDLAFGADVDSADTSTFGNTWKTAIAGQAVAKVDIKGYYDPALTALPAALQVENAVVTYMPSGTAIGDNARLMALDPASYAESSPVGGVVGFQLSGATDGTVGFGYALLPKTTISASTTGAAKDDGAATTTGAIAQLHVTNIVSATGSWVVLIQDSADGSTGWTTIGTFAAKTAVGAERIVIAGTVRRWVRYVNTVTGGTTPACTFALAFART